MNYFTLEELQQMSKDQLILLSLSLQKDIEIFRSKKEHKTGIYVSGSPDYVRDFVNTRRRLLEEERGVDNAK